MLTNRFSVVFLILVLQQLYCWETISSTPSGHHSQFFVLQNDGSYNYGYDTGDGIVAKQLADTANQVSGSYFYKSPSGANINLKYTSGVQGFVPETLPVSDSIPQSKIKAEDDQSATDAGDASYSFSFDTPTYRRSETSDRRGNVQGVYSYIDETGMHDLRFTAGENTGFLPTSGSLSKPNGLTIDQVARIPLIRTRPIQPNADLDSGSTAEPPSTTNLTPTEPAITEDSSDASTFSTDESSREASTDGAGLQATTTESTVPLIPETKPISLVAGSESTGFQSIVGSLNAPLDLINTQFRSTQHLQKPLILEQPTSYIASGFVPVLPLIPTTQTRQQLDYNVVAHRYVPTSDEDRKLFGYIIDTI